MVYGIDLGTTNSCVACINQYGQAEILPNSLGSRTTPSVVYFSEDGYSYTVGQIAKNGQVNDYKQTVSFIKREMGKDYEPPTPFPNNLTPTEISARILSELVKDANNATDGEDCFDVVITCPAYFGTVAREQTRLAGELAGLNVLRIINEPTAAAIAYGKKFKDDEEKYVLVYDLGGGTFDVTLIRIRGKNFKVIVTGGSATLGGYDWDLRLAEKFLERFNKECSTNYSFEDNPGLKNQFMLFAEDTKKFLTAREQTRVDLGWQGTTVKFTVTREEFDSWTKDLLDQTIKHVRALLEKARQKGVELTKATDILCVGGSSRMPQVTKRLTEEFGGIGCEILLRDPDECVAKGAAQIGDIVEEQEDISVIKDSEDRFTFYDVTAKTYGTDMMKRGDTNTYVRNLVFANSTLPARGDHTFCTSYDNQDYIPINIYESDSMEKVIAEKDAVFLDEGKQLPLPPNLPQGTPVDIRFEVDKQGILHVTASAASESIDFELKLKGIMTAEEFKRAKEDLEASQSV